MNKNVSLGINVVLAIAVAVLYYLHFKSPSPSELDLATGSDSSSAKIITPKDLKASDIVYVNIDSINENYTFLTNAKKTFTAKRKRLESQLDGKMNDFQAQYTNYQTKGRNGQLSAEEIQNTEARLMKMQNDIQNFKQTEEEKLFEEEQKIQTTLYNNLNSFMKRYCAKTNYKFVMAYTQASGLLYANDSLDITNDVLKGLNAEVK